MKLWLLVTHLKPIAIDKPDQRSINNRMNKIYSVEENPSLNLIRKLGLSLIAERYEPIFSIGASFGGSAFIGRDLKSGEKVFMKYLISPRGPIEKAKFHIERDALKAPDFLNREVTPKLLHFGEFPDLQTEVIVTNFIEGESLSEFLKRSHKLSVKEKLEVFQRIILALSFSSSAFEHRDVHPGNIILLPPETVKIGPDYNDVEVETGVRILDWGEAMPTLLGAFEDEPDYHFTMLAASPTLLSGSITNIPPETFKPHERKTFSSGQYDCWGMGLLLYTLITNNPPPRAKSIGHYAQEVHDGSLQNRVNREVMSTMSMQVPGGLVIQWLLAWMLMLDPSKRAKLADVKRVLWDVRFEGFSSCDTDTLKTYFSNPDDYEPDGGWEYSGPQYQD